MPKSVVTGGAGFIGSNLAHYLCAQGHRVVVIDNLSTGSADNLSSENLEGYIETGPSPISFVEGDVRDHGLLAEVLDGADFVFHQAALPSVPRSIDDPWSSNDHNVNGTLSVLMAARDAGVRRVVYAASSSVYGNTEVLPKVETMKAGPLSPYAVSKHVGELYCRVFNEVYGLETVALRYFNVFGPRQQPGSAYAAAIPKFMAAFRHGEPPVVYGNGEQTRDFTYVENVVRANLAAATAEAKRVAGRIFNIGCGDRVSINDLLREIKALTGSDVVPIYTDARPGDVHDSQADITAAQEAFGYEPHVDLREGLRRTLEWFERRSGRPLQLLGHPLGHP
jgi:nucleoside-diphosphate-sugar epimerase